MSKHSPFSVGSSLGDSWPTIWTGWQLAELAQLGSAVTRGGFGSHKPAFHQPFASVVSRSSADLEGSLG